MKIVKRVEWAVNGTNIPPGSIIYIAGNAATPQVLLRQLAADTSIFPANSKEGYQWPDFNSSVQSRPSNRSRS